MAVILSVNVLAQEDPSKFKFQLFLTELYEKSKGDLLTIQLELFASSLRDADTWVSLTPTIDGILLSVSDSSERKEEHIKKQAEFLLGRYKEFVASTFKVWRLKFGEAEAEMLRDWLSSLKAEYKAPFKDLMGKVTDIEEGWKWNMPRIYQRGKTFSVYVRIRGRTCRPAFI